MGVRPHIPVGIIPCFYMWRCPARRHHARGESEWKTQPLGESQAALNELWVGYSILCPTMSQPWCVSYVFIPRVVWWNSRCFSQLTGEIPDWKRSFFFGLDNDEAVCVFVLILLQAGFLHDQLVLLGRDGRNSGHLMTISGLAGAMGCPYMLKSLVNHEPSAWQLGFGAKVVDPIISLPFRDDRSIIHLVMTWHNH